MVSFSAISLYDMSVAICYRSIVFIIRMCACVFVLVGMCMNVCMLGPYVRTLVNATRVIVIYSHRDLH